MLCTEFQMTSISLLMKFSSDNNYVRTGTWKRCLAHWILNFQNTERGIESSVFFGQYVACIAAEIWTLIFVVQIVRSQRVHEDVLRRGYFLSNPVLAFASVIALLLSFEMSYLCTCSLLIQPYWFGRHQLLGPDLRPLYSCTTEVSIHINLSNVHSEQSIDLFV